MVTRDQTSHPGRTSSSSPSAPSPVFHLILLTVSSSEATFLSVVASSSALRGEGNSSFGDVGGVETVTCDCLGAQLQRHILYNNSLTDLKTFHVMRFTLCIPGGYVSTHSWITPPPIGQRLTGKTFYEVYKNLLAQRRRPSGGWISPRPPTSQRTHSPVFEVSEEYLFGCVFGRVHWKFLLSFQKIRSHLVREYPANEHALLNHNRPVRVDSVTCASLWSESSAWRRCEASMGVDPRPLCPLSSGLADFSSFFFAGEVCPPRRRALADPGG